jgi:hypothetical protein
MKLNTVSMVLVVLEGVISQLAEFWIVWKQSRIMEFSSCSHRPQINYETS